MIFSAACPQKGYKNLEMLKLNSSLQDNCKESQIPSVINTFHRDSPLVSAHAGSSVTEVFLPSMKKKMAELWFWQWHSLRSDRAGHWTRHGPQHCSFLSLKKAAEFLLLGIRIYPVRCRIAQFCLHLDLGDAGQSKSSTDLDADISSSSGTISEVLPAD